MHAFRRYTNGTLFIAVSLASAASAWFQLPDDHPAPMLEHSRSAAPDAPRDVRPPRSPAAHGTASSVSPASPASPAPRASAVKVLQQCRGSAIDAVSGAGTTGTPADPPDYSPPGQDAGKPRKQADAADRLYRRCAEFDFEDVAESRVRGLWKAGRDKDPLIKASVDYSNAFDADYRDEKGKQTRTRALERILKLGDPLLLDDLNLRLALHADGGMKVFVLGGQRFDLNSDTDVGAAIYLLPCAVGLRCDESEFDMSARCAAGGDCMRSRFEHVERMVENIPGAYPKIVAAYEAMRAAVVARDARFFARR